jgi:hypothetical protein
MMVMAGFDDGGRLVHAKVRIDVGSSADTFVFISTSPTPIVAPVSMPLKAGGRGVNVENIDTRLMRAQVRSAQQDALSPETEAKSCLYEHAGLLDLVYTPA